MRQTPDEIEIGALRASLRDLISQCTAKQHERFAMLYVLGIDNMPREALRSAIALCNRTLNQNETGDIGEIDVQMHAKYQDTVLRQAWMPLA